MDLTSFETTFPYREREGEFMLQEAKRRKLDYDLDPLHYPYIPEDAQDLPSNRPPGYVTGGSVWTRVIEETNSIAWGPPAVAAARACIEPAVTTDNETLIRTYHPALSVAPLVYAHTEITGKTIWKVFVVADFEIRHTHAGGRAIHVQPNFFTPDPLRNLIPSEVMILRSIYPRRMLTFSDISAIREALPTSVGIRIFISGLAVVLYKNKTDMIAALNRPCPSYIGDLNVGYDILRIEPSAETTKTGHSVANSPNSFESRGNLGLRIQLADGVNAVTTVTHGFVKLPRPPRAFSRAADWLVSAKQALSKFKSPRDTGVIPSDVEMREKRTMSPVGKEVFLVGMPKKIGKISKTYDNPSSVLPYPAGYRHDLSLITGSNLPEVLSPAGAITKWGDYHNALDGESVFLARFNAVTNRERTEIGEIPTKQTKDALIEGAEYLWVSRAVSASLLWRTKEDYTDLRNFSGSVLCLGRPCDASVKALVFQNYQTPVRHLQVIGERPLKGDHSWTFKGGFLLPKEIRDSLIISSVTIGDERNHQTFPARCPPKDGERRNFTGHH